MNRIDKITYYLLKALSKWLNNMSKPNRELFSKRLASFVYHQITIRKQKALQNIQTAFPEKSDAWATQTLKSTYYFFVKNFVDFLSFPQKYTIRTNGNETFETALKKKNGIIVVTAHFGPWEIMMDWMGLQNYPLFVVFNRQKNRGADIFFRELRERIGINHIHRKEPLESMYRVLENGNILGLASDQDAKKRGVFVDFFGQPSSTPKGAARFYKQSKSSLFLVISHEDTDGKIIVDFQDISVSREATIQEIAQSFTTRIEQKIREHPEQYFWFHRRWKTKPQ